MLAKLRRPQLRLNPLRLAYALLCAESQSG